MEQAVVDWCIPDFFLLVKHLYLVIFAGWNPLIVIGGAYLFGGLDAATLYIQAIGTNIPSHFLGMAPYVLTILVLLIAARRRQGGLGPAALAIPYDSEER